MVLFTEPYLIFLFISSAISTEDCGLEFAADISAIITVYFFLFYPTGPAGVCFNQGRLVPISFSFLFFERRGIGLVMAEN